MADLNMIKPRGVQNLINKFCFTIGMLPTSYKESLTYEEQILAIGHYLETTVYPAINNNAEALTELQGLFVALEDYVNNYFDNLDVQEEINNKLDDMVKQGTLQEIIADYLNSKAIFGFDSVADMKNATNLINGSYAKTLGYHSKNDGGKALYKIREITNDDVVDEMTIIEINDSANDLIAELIVDSEINIKKLGAYGDNIHDDTLIFQNALNLFDNIFIPKGDYLISNALIQNTTDRIINIKGEKNLSKLISSANTEIFTFNKTGQISIENINLKRQQISHSNRLASFENLNKLYINKVNVNGIDENNKTNKDNILIKNVVISTIENSVFNNASLDVQTWDLKISKSWFWSVSENYCIKLYNSGNINIDNCDFVPPFINRHSNYIETKNLTSENWNSIITQAAIIIENQSNGINITNCYIDGNDTARTGRGILINGGSFNINIINNRSNLMDDNLITINSSYLINISNNYLLNYALDTDDCVSFVAIYKKGTQNPGQIKVDNNIINAHNVNSSTPVPVIAEYDNISSLLSADYNNFYGNTSKDVWSTEISLNNYNSLTPISNNKSSVIKYTSGHQFKSTGTFDVASGATGKSITISTYLFPYDLLPQNIKIVANNRIVPNFRMQKISNNQYYIAFAEALSSDTQFYYTASM